MVTVARVTAPTVAPEPLSGTRVTARMDPNAASGLARGLSDVGQVVSAIAAQEQEKAETAQLLEARRKLGDWQRAWFDPANEKGVYSRKGRDALGLVDEIAPEFERVSSELAQGLTSPRARMAFQQYADGQRDSVLDRVSGYAVREHDAYVEAEFKASVASAADLAAQAASEGRTEDLARHTQEGLQVIRAQGALAGAPPELTAMQEAEYLSTVHTTAADGFLARGDVDAAVAYLGAHGAEMTAAARNDLLARMSPLMVDSMVDHVEASLGSGMPVAVGALPSAGAATSLREAEAIAVASVGRTIKLESGGQANARNPRSSAEGPAQFIDSTWWDMLARHRPELVAGVPRPGRGRKLPAHVVALKQDTKLAGLMAAEYAKENARFLYEAGLPVTEESVYLAHRFGPGTAASLLRAPAGTTVASLVSPAVMQANPDLQGKTVEQLSASHAARAGEPAAAPAAAAPAEDPVLVPSGRTVAEAMRERARNTTNVRLRRGLEQRANQLEAQAERERAEYERSMTDAIWATVGNGGKLTPEQAAFARANRMEGSIEAERLRQVRGTLVQDDPVLVDALHTEAIDSPETFRKRILSNFTDRLSPSTRAQLMKMQADLEKPDARQKLLTSDARVTRMAVALGYDKGEDSTRARGLLRQAWSLQVEAFIAETGREPTPAEADKLQASVQRRFLDDRQGAERRTRAALRHGVSGADRRIVREELQAVLGRMPSREEVDAELARVYRGQTPAETY